MKKVYSIALCLLISLLLTLTACGQTGVTITVSFQVEGAQYHSTSTAQGKMPTMPTDPSKDGYTFDAWYYDDGVWEKPMTAQSFLDLPITENMTVTVYAHFTENEPEPQGMNFEEAIAAYKSRTSFYITFDVMFNGVTANDIEWYEDSDTLIVKTIAVIDEPLVTWYLDKAANKTYSVDKTQQKLVPADTVFVVNNQLVPPITGNGADGTITIDSISYPCKDFVVATDVTARFVNDRNKLFAIVFTNDAATQTRTYSDVFISDTIPTTSDLYGVADYEKSNWIAKTVVSDSMSPTLSMGTTYYFEPVDATTLEVGDIILVNAVIGSQTTTVAHRIVNITDNAGVLTFTLKGDNNALPDATQYSEDDVVGVLVDGQANNPGSSGGDGGPGGIGE